MRQREKGTETKKNAKPGKNYGARMNDLLKQRRRAKHRVSKKKAKR